MLVLSWLVPLVIILVSFYPFGVQAISPLACSFSIFIYFHIPLKGTSHAPLLLACTLYYIIVFQLPLKGTSHVPLALDRVGLYP